jgi:hypothetical protein
LQGQPHPRFHAKAWLPFKMAQGSVKWSIQNLPDNCWIQLNSEDVNSIKVGGKTQFTNHSKRSDD